MYRKPKELENGEYEEPNAEEKILDLNNKPQAEQHKTFINKIKGLIKEPQSTYVFWIHGIDDDNLAAESKQMSANGIKGLVGYGQPDQHSMDEEKAQALVNHFEALKFDMAKTRDKADNYRGWNQDNMNQWFKEEKNGFGSVQSVQLEFAFTGVRDEDSIVVSSQAIAGAIAKLVDAKPVPEQESIADTELVEAACTHVKGLIDDNNAMLKVGQYLIETFYAGNYEWAKNKQRFKNKSLIEVIEKLSEYGYAPAKTWFYNAVKLAVDEREFKDFRTYGKLGHSHKVYLTHVEKFEDKKKLIEETVENTYTVKQLRARIAEVNGSDQNGENKDKLPPIDTIKEMSVEKRAKKIQVVEKRKDSLKEIIDRLMKDVNNRKKEQKACEDWLKQVSDLGQEGSEQKSDKAA